MKTISKMIANVPVFECVLFEYEARKKNVFALEDSRTGNDHEDFGNFPQRLEVNHKTELLKDIRQELE